MRPAVVIPACALAILGAWTWAVPLGNATGATADQLRHQLAKERKAYRTEIRGLRRALNEQGTVDEALTIASIAYGVPRAELSAVSWCESRHNPEARNGRYRGLFQQGPMFEATPYGRAGLSVWSAYAAAMSTAYVVSQQGWVQWECSPRGAFRR